MCRAVALLCSLAASKALAPPRRLQKLTEQLPIMEHPTESVYALEGRGTRADPKKVSENVKKCHLSRTIYANDAHGSGDRAELVALAQVLYKKFRYPTLYEVPQSIAWWDTRLQRPTLSSVLEMFQQATKTKLNYFRRMFCEEKRRSKQHLAEHLRRKNPSDARQEIKPLVLSLVKKLDKGSCEIAAKTWDEFLESRVNGLEAIIEAAQQTADGYKYLDPESTNLCGELAQIVEAPVHQVRLLMGITDAVLTKRLAEYYTRRANPPRGTKPGPYPPWDNLMLGDNFVPARLAKLS